MNLNGDKMQLDLFKEPVVINEDPERRVCKKCGEEKSLDDFNAIYYRKNGEATKGYRCAILDGSQTT